ncbi:MAG: hypothetical protein ABJE66_14580 [Deltaproteobacteria bacterium]
MSDYDASQATTQAPHPKAKKETAAPKDHQPHETKAPLGVDSTRTGQALDHLLKAGKAITAVRTITSAMATKASHDLHAALEMRPLIAPHHDLALSELDATWMQLNRNTSDEVDHGHGPTEDVKAKELAHPGMRDAADKVTHELAQVIVDIDTLGGFRHAPKYELQNITGGLIGSLRHVRANLGLEPKGYDDLLKMVSITVHADSVKLGTGGPKLEMLTSVISMTNAFDRTTGNMMLAVKDAVDIISKTEIEKHDGVLSTMWDQAKEILNKLSEAISGVTWPIAVADKAVGKILEYQEQAQKKLIGSDLENYVSTLEKQGKALQEAASAEGGSTDVESLVDDLDEQFSDLGQDNPDAWKPGDQAVVGKQAEFLKSLHRDSQHVRAMVPTTSEFVYQFLTSFVNANSKERPSSALRSPFSGSTHQDGYAHVELKLEQNALVGGWMLIGDTATLHCPNAGSIAPQLMANSNNFSLAELGTDVVIDIEVADGSRDSLPGLWGDDRVRTIRLDRNHSLMNHGAASVWNWVQTYTHHTADEILSAVTKLEED